MKFLLVFVWSVVALNVNIAVAQNAEPMKPAEGNTISQPAAASPAATSNEEAVKDELPWLKEAEEGSSAETGKPNMEIIPIGDQTVGKALEATEGESYLNSPIPKIAYSVYFNDASNTEFTDQVRAELDQLVQLMRQDERIRLRLQSYAFAQGNPSDSEARRLSLSRAIKMREFFLDKGVLPDRIVVQALGSTAKDGVKNRIDVLSM